MKVKTIEIAKALGLSKATVSLALNGKPGVNEQTRQRILAYKERLEAMPEVSQLLQQMPVEEPGLLQKKVRLVVMNRRLGLVQDCELDMWTDVKALFDKLAREMGYSLEVVYFQIGEDDPTRLAGDCNQPEVAGVVIQGTELQAEDAYLLEGIQKPLVIYDCDLFDERYPCVAVSDFEAVRMAMEQLKRKGKRHICYISRNMEVYNYSQRREAFSFFTESRKAVEKGIKADLVCAEGSIDEIYRKIKEYLSSLSSYPDAFLLESFHISIGFLRAARELGLTIPEDFSVIGIDRLPEYITAGAALTAVRIPYTERVKLTMLLLEHEIRDPFPAKSKIFTNPSFYEGNTLG